MKKRGYLLFKKANVLTNMKIPVMSIFSMEYKLESTFGHFTGLRVT